MGCPHTVSTLTQAMGIVFWGAVTLFIHFACLYLNWNGRWYAYLRKYTMVPPERGIFSALTVLTLAGSYAGWRLWFCDNWDSSPAPLAVCIFMVLFTNLFYTCVMAFRMIEPAFLVSIIGLALSVTFTVLAFLTSFGGDTWAGVVGIAYIVANIWFLLQAGQIWSESPKIYENYKTEKGEMISKKERAKASVPVPSASTSGESGVEAPKGTSIGELRYRGNSTVFDPNKPVHFTVGGGKP